MPKKKITLEKLAQMVQRGFAETATRSDIHKLEERLEKLEGRVDSLEKNVDYGFETVKHELKRIGEEIRMLDYGPEVHDLRIRVERLEKKVGLRK